MLENIQCLDSDTVTHIEDKQRKMSPNQQTWSLTPNYFETQPAWLPDTFSGMTTWAGENSNYGADIKQGNKQIYRIC